MRSKIEYKARITYIDADEPLLYLPEGALIIFTEKVKSPKAGFMITYAEPVGKEGK